MMIWDEVDDLPDTPEVHGGGGSAPSKAAQLDARDDFKADDDARDDALWGAYEVESLCVVCGRMIQEPEVLSATLVSDVDSRMRLAHEGECSAAAFKANGRATGKYSARGMRGLKIGRAT